MSQWSSVYRLVKSSKTFLVTTHYTPDADALGSALSVALWLKSLKKKVIVVNEDEAPQWLTFLPGIKLLKKTSSLKAIDYDCAFVLDCGDIDRVGKTKALLLKGKPMINIDHHISNPKFGTVNIVRPKASSTSELIGAMLDDAKYALNKQTAQLLYAGIMTDTGSFKYDITRSTTHALAARCLALGVNPSRMHQLLYPPMPGKDMAHFIEVIASAKLLLKNRLYSVALTRAQLQKFSKGFDWKERVLTFLRTVEGIDVVMISSELHDGLVRVNLRSQSDLDVARIAAQVKGGGHPKAAGATVKMSLTKAQATMVRLIKKAL